jgi:hypothetical protein
LRIKAKRLNGTLTQARYWRIQYEKEFLQTIENIRTGNLGKTEDESVGIFYLILKIGNYSGNELADLQIMGLSLRC